LDELDQAAKGLNDQLEVQMYGLKCYSRDTRGNVDDIIDRHDLTNMLMGHTEIPAEITVCGQTLSQEYFNNVNCGLLVAAWKNYQADPSPGNQVQFLIGLFGPSFNYGRFVMNLDSLRRDQAAIRAADALKLMHAAQLAAPPADGAQPNPHNVVWGSIAAAPVAA
jgi:hypothetical protein